jgi:hypothetical protein
MDEVPPPPPLPKDFTMVSDGNDLFLVRKNGTTAQVTAQQKKQIEDAMDLIFGPLGSGVRVKGPKILD